MFITRIKASSKGHAADVQLSNEFGPAVGDMTKEGGARYQTWNLIQSRRRWEELCFEDPL